MECVDVLAKAHALAQPYGNVTYDAWKQEQFHNRMGWMN